LHTFDFSIKNTFNDPSTYDPTTQTTQSPSMYANMHPSMHNLTTRLPLTPYSTHSTTHFPSIHNLNTYFPSTYPLSTYPPSTYPSSTYSTSSYQPSTHPPSTYLPSIYNANTHSPANTQ